MGDPHMGIPHMGDPHMGNPHMGDNDYLDLRLLLFIVSKHPPPVPFKYEVSRRPPLCENDLLILIVCSFHITQFGPESSYSDPDSDNMCPQNAWSQIY